MADRPQRLERSDFRHFCSIPTRWIDNDAYGHVNNVVYYSFFDTAVNGFLVQAGLLDIASSPIIAVVVETGCSFFESVAFPEAIETGLAVTEIGHSSVRYRVGIFRIGAEQAIAQGHFVHVYVSRDTRRPVKIPAATLAALDSLRT